MECGVTDFNARDGKHDRALSKGEDRAAACHACHQQGPLLHRELERQERRLGLHKVLDARATEPAAEQQAD